MSRPRDTFGAWLPGRLAPGRRSDPLPRSPWLIGLLLLLVGCGGPLLSLPELECQTSAGAGGVGTAVHGLPEPPLVLRWQRRLDGAPLGAAWLQGQVLLQATTAPSLWALDRGTGQVLAKHSWSVPQAVPPVLTGPYLVVGELGKVPVLKGYGRADGHLRWTWPGVAGAPLLVRGDTVLVAEEGSGLTALRATTGQRIWRIEIGGRMRAAPALDDGRVYAGNSAGVVVAADLASGSERWRCSLGAGIRTRPATGQGKVFVGLADGEVVALDADTGGVVWRARLGGWPAPEMALTAGALVVASVDRGVYALDPGSGRLLWRFETRGAVRGSPAASGRTVYCGSSDGQAYGLDLGTGQVAWSYRLDGPALQPVCLGQEMVSITSENRTVYAFGR